MTAAAALREAAAEAAAPTRDLAGWCLMAVRGWLDVPAGAGSAIEAWNAVETPDRHSLAKADVRALLAVPAGVPVFWAIGKHGHVALSAGGGRVYSTDIRRRGKVDLVPITEVAARWGARLLGWSETLNDRRVYTPPKPPAKPKPKPKPPKAPASVWAVHRIVRGDTVSGLVAAHAVPGTNWREVWGDERNDELRALRRRPELIRAGDRLWIGPADRA